MRFRSAADVVRRIAHKRFRRDVFARAAVPHRRRRCRRYLALSCDTAIKAEARLLRAMRDNRRPEE